MDNNHHRESIPNKATHFDDESSHAKQNLPLKGSWDIHVHASPCVHPRKMTAIELANKAQQSGMSGLVLKSHHGSTSEVASVIDGLFPHLRILGGITLNNTVGGLNAAAVEASFKVGGKMVWLPTKDGAGHNKITKGVNTEPVTILDSKGNINKATQEIISITDENDGVLATGHISKQEIFTLHNYLVRNIPRLRMLVNHSLFLTPNMDASDIKQLSNSSTYFECCYLTVSKLFSHKSAKQIAQIVNNSIESKWIIASDAGQPSNLDPVEAISEFQRLLIDAGMSQRRLYEASVITPDALLS